MYSISKFRIWASMIDSSESTCSTVCESEIIQDSPRLAPLKTPRSGSASSISDFDLLRSSNDSLGKFNLGKVVLGSTSENDEASQNSPRGASSGISALDIGDLQARVTNVWTILIDCNDIAIEVQSNRGVPRGLSWKSEGQGRVWRGFIIYRSKDGLLIGWHSCLI